MWGIPWVDIKTAYSSLKTVKRNAHMVDEDELDRTIKEAEELKQNSK